jgi:hypothetical protein
VSNGRQSGTQSVELTVDKSSTRAAVTRGPREAEEPPSLEAVARKRLVEIVID